MLRPSPEGEPLPLGGWQLSNEVFGAARRPVGEVANHRGEVVVVDAEGLRFWPAAMTLALSSISIRSGWRAGRVVWGQMVLHQPEQLEGAAERLAVCPRGGQLAGEPPFGVPHTVEDKSHPAPSDPPGFLMADGTEPARSCP